MLGTLVDLHSLETNANGSRGDNDNSVAILSQLESSVYNQSEDWQEGFMSLLIYDGARPCKMTTVLDTFTKHREMCIPVTLLFTKTVKQE